MLELELRPETDRVPRAVYTALRPVDFETWLALTPHWDTELIGGVVVERMAAQYPHEWIFAWLMSIMRPFAGYFQLGTVLGSRSAVKVSATDGRLPDILFVRAANAGIIHKDAIYGVPDLVIEIVSENDRPSDLIPLEADYCALGVPEIVFINPKKDEVRFVTKRGGSYIDHTLTTGRLEFACLPGFHVEVEWLFAEVKPDEFTITRQLIADREKAMQGHQA